MAPELKVRVSTPETLAERFEEFLQERFNGQPCTPEMRLHLKYTYFAGAVEGAFNPRAALREVVVYVESLARQGDADAMMLLPLEGQVQ